MMLRLWRRVRRQSSPAKGQMSQREESTSSARHTIRLLGVGPMAVLASTAAVIVVQRVAAALVREAFGSALKGPNQVQIAFLSSSNEPALFTAFVALAAADERHLRRHHRHELHV